LGLVEDHAFAEEVEFGSAERPVGRPPHIATMHPLRPFAHVRLAAVAALLFSRISLQSSAVSEIRPANVPGPASI
jgi:hypothetical protein